MKPLIGVSSYIMNKETYYGYGTSGDYIKAIENAGGIPVQIPVMQTSSDYEQVLRYVDGMLIPGGIDVAPYFYHEQPDQHLGRVDAVIDRHEMELVRLAYDAGIPLLGICRGMQLINVVFGGTLYQDIPSMIPQAIGHNQDGCKRYELYHEINLTPNTLFHQMIGKDSIYVNSFHHQSVKDLGNELKVVATASDGVVEAFEGTGDRFVLGVQFHPENLSFSYSEFHNLFRSFISQCMARKI